MAANSSAIATRSAESAVVRNPHLVWLHSHVDEDDTNFRSCLVRLRPMVNRVDTFTNANKCVHFLKQIHLDQQILMMVSEPLGEKIAPLIRDVHQLDSIYVFCPDASANVQWTQSWPKIKGVFTEFESLRTALQRAERQSNQDSVQISIVSTNAGANVQSLDQLEPSFMYTQLLQEILMEINDETDGKALQELATHARELYNGDVSELKNIDQFVQEYDEHTPIWWYTYECFLYPMLNRSLRLFDVNVILKMGFFLRDLHRHIEQLHTEQAADNSIPFTVYRGQALPKTYLDKMRRTNGGLLAFNNFLSTSKDRRVSMNFARCALGSPDVAGILYTMSIDPAVSSAPFASLSGVSYYEDIEQEILFSMNTVFRIDEVKPIGSDERLWEVHLTLTADNDPRLHDLLAHLRQDTQGATGWQRLARLLIRLGQSKQAEDVYQFLLGQTSDEPIQAYYYHQLGCVRYQQGEYTQAIASYQNALDIFAQVLPADHPHVATSYNSMGAAYFSNGDYSKAVSLYQQALAIRQKTLPANHPSLAALYTNLAIVYMKLQEHGQALSYYKKSLEIDENNLPSNHPELATTYNNIGGAYENMNNYSQSLAFYQKALEIREVSLPPNHPDLGESYHNTGSVYCTMGEYVKALTAHEKALSIRENHLPTNHPDLAFTYSGLGLLYLNIGEYAKARSFFEKALEIRRKVLPPNHPDLATAFNNMGVVCESLQKYSEALVYFEDAVKIAKQLNHPHLSLFQNSLALIQKKV